MNTALHTRTGIQKLFDLAASIAAVSTIFVSVLLGLKVAFANHTFGRDETSKNCSNIFENDTKYVRIFVDF